MHQTFTIDILLKWVLLTAEARGVLRMQGGLHLLKGLDKTLVLVFAAVVIAVSHRKVFL